MSGWVIADAMLLFLCASIYLGTGWSLALFTLPGRHTMTVHTYYDQIIAPIQRATRFFTVMTIVMVVAAIALVVAEWDSAYVLAPIAVLAAVVGATLLTTLVLFRYNRRLKARITDERELHEVLDRWVSWNWARLALWTAEWGAMAVYFGAKLR